MPKPLTIGDLLKSEADYHTREAIPAPAGTKIGQLVAYPPRDSVLVALSDEVHGQVLVQPQNCVICADNIDTSTLNGITIDRLRTIHDPFGIKYVQITDGSSTSPSSEPLPNPPPIG